MAIKIGSDGFLQLVVRGGLLKPQAQVVLQVLVELVTWKKQEEKNSSKHNSTSQNLLRSVLSSLSMWCHSTKRKVVKGHDISIVKMPLGAKVQKSGHVYFPFFFAKTEVLQFKKKKSLWNTHIIISVLYISSLQHGERLCSHTAICWAQVSVLMLTHTYANMLKLAMQTCW